MSIEYMQYSFLEDTREDDTEKYKGEKVKNEGQIINRRLETKGN